MWGSVKYCPDWRCPSLDDWLHIEYNVTRHDPINIEIYIREKTREWMTSDPFELGKF
jgi:hypothetical protein